MALCLFAVADAQLLINEYSHRNSKSIADEFGKHSDWMELINNTSGSLNLGGYSLSDDSTKPGKWHFPKIALRPQEKLLVFASGRDKRFATHHWETAIFSHNIWKYHLPNEELPTDWKEVNFNDSTWLSGVGGMGLGDGDDGTIIPQVTAVFLRKKFVVADSASLAEAVLHADYDDAFVAYLNGVEIARSLIGAPGEFTPFNAFPIAQHEATMYRGLPAEAFFISNEKLKSIIRNGENVLSVQVHNTFGSNDISSNFFLSFGINSSQEFFSAPPAWFALKGSSFHTNFKLATGETISVFNTSGNLIDSKKVAELSMDNSEGRTTDGANSWCVFTAPTPMDSNEKSVCFSGYEATPAVSLQGGFYNGAQTVSATASPASIIRYTTNGNIPTETDRAFVHPISVDTTTVLSFRAFSTAGKLPSKPVKHTYFINEEDFTLPVISISTDEANLWSDSAGILVKGPNASSGYPFFGANFWQKWEQFSHLEYFDAAKQKQFAVDFGLKIHGNWSRGQLQKGLRVDLDHKYGFPLIHHTLIPDKPQLTKYRAFNLRNGGNDFYGSRFRDAVMQRNMRHTNVDYMAYAPVVVFLNGEYWGLYELREKMDQQYLRFNRGANPDAVDLISYDHNLGFQVHNGDDSAFYDMLYRITSTDPADDANFYQLLNNHLDLPNYTDYFATEIFYANSDWMGEWTNNIKCWREKKPGTKWRYMLWDLDYGCGFVHPDGNVAMSKPTDVMWNRARRPVITNEHARLFNQAIQNITFRNYFLNRFADLMNTVFKRDTFEQHATQMRDEIEPAMQRHHQRWGGNLTSFHNTVDSMIWFVTERPQHVYQHAITEFGLNKTAEITIDAQPEGTGKILLNTITPENLPWSGLYFDGVPVALKAIPADGYEFSHWQANQLMQQNTVDSFAVNLSVNDTFVAVFRKTEIVSGVKTLAAAAPYQLLNLPNEWQLNFASDETFTTTVYDVLGKKCFSATAEKNVRLPKSSLAKGVYLIEANNGKQKFTMRVVRED